jgi:hypothetical protein
MNCVTRNFEEIRCNAMATLVLLEREHPDFFYQVLKVKRVAYICTEIMMML